MRQERWGFSWRGWLAFLILVAGGLALVLWRIHPFLAVTDRVEADFLIVQGWIPGYALVETAKEIQGHSYRKVICVGGLLNYSAKLDPDDTNAHRGSRRLQKLGVNSELLVTVPTASPASDDTVACASSVRKWFQENAITPKGVNVVTLGVCARKTRLAYEKGLDQRVRVGVLAISNRDYPADQWWKYSEGVKKVIEEGSAYLQLRLVGAATWAQ